MKLSNEILLSAIFIVLCLIYSTMIGMIRIALEPLPIDENEPLDFTNMKRANPVHDLHEVGE